jgi:hypothetical protein
MHLASKRLKSNAAPVTSRRRSLLLMLLLARPLLVCALGGLCLSSPSSVIKQGWVLSRDD